KLWLALLFATILGTGCKKDYLQLNPPASLSPDKIFANTKNAMATINGMHRMLYVQWYGNQATGGISGNLIYTEVLGEDFVMTAQANGWFVSEYRWLQHRNESSTMNRWHYGFFYAFIGNANMIIANIDNAEGPENDKKLLKGQAYAYRAWAYFNLVQLFGERYDAGGANNSLGMSLVLEPRTGALPRSTVAETYAQINADLEEPSNLLNGLSRPAKSHLNTDVVKGLKARVALTQQDWAVA